jgi:hypothetical protein
MNFGFVSLDDALSSSASFRLLLLLERDDEGVVDDEDEAEDKWDELDTDDEPECINCGFVLCGELFEGI